ncbi:hypothetical protein KIPB_005911, partial [Kipferlia bialata]|eukprot:g5911.t1
MVPLHQISHQMADITTIDLSNKTAFE